MQRCICGYRRWLQAVGKKDSKKLQFFFKKPIDIFLGLSYTNRAVRETHQTTARGPVAQLDRVFDYESKGRGFESRRAHQKEAVEELLLFFAFWLSCVLFMVNIITIFFELEFTNLQCKFNNLKRS